MTDSYDPRAPGALYPSLVVKKVQIRVWENIVCSRCGEEQETVFEEGLQIRNGLLLTVEGGYGMYVDTDDIHKLLLCGGCIALLRDKWPGLDQVCNLDDGL
jgi:hypothetical protein